jgi:hypothetical protein
MIKLLCLLLMAVPLENGKVILNTQVADAEFFLDGNFVAVTDAKGTLTMENFPAGSFNYSIEKKGYQPYKGSFSIVEGEIKQLTPMLEKVFEQEAPPVDESPATGTPSSAASATKKIRKASIPVENTLPISRAPSAANAPVFQPSQSQAAPDNNSQTKLLWLIISILLAIVLLILLLSIRRRNRLEQHVLSMDESPKPEPLRPQADNGNRPDPRFIEKLRRKEELINAGFFASKPQVIDPASMKEKEVVIVLPKEAFRIEDDK